MLAVDTVRKPRRPLRIAFIGWGAVARRVGELLVERDREKVTIVAAAVRDLTSERPGLPEDALRISAPDALADLDCDMIIEAAGRAAVGIWGEAAVLASRRFVISSASALSDDILLARLEAAAKEAGSQIIVPPGALAGIDALAAAAALPVDHVVHTIVKPPLAWKSTPVSDVLDLDRLNHASEFFIGSARQAAEWFPLNANVAVITALAGIGLDRTELRMVADPAATRNIHRISAIGAFGTLDVAIACEPLAANPKSSEMTALGLFRAIENQIAPLVR